MDQLFQKIDPSNLATTIASGETRGNSSSMTIKESNNSTKEQNQTKRLKLSPSCCPFSFSLDSKNQYKGWTVPHDGFLLPTIQYEINKDSSSSSSSSSSPSSSSS
eukprot:CAMPEP_0176498744 /NCGR_PEP_ID=MMETSP0200_2-20121128/12506_1 /TAXON_ID=947934 /ORGANISM="Chaetoceros sp., Strain GSL56" /LENGTH=104 /DNA_ID=CAMNT_0017897015 /DNA_START=66 /DNA_END=376 /DNA_ORIENTATION=-